MDTKTIELLKKASKNIDWAQDDNTMSDDSYNQLNQILESIEECIERQ